MQKPGDRSSKNEKTDSGLNKQPLPEELNSYLLKGIADARKRLFELQEQDGHWCAELEGDTILESEYILCMYFLGRGNEAKIKKATEYIREKQLPDGGWAIYPGGTAEVSASAKAYLCLKLAGHDPESPEMIRSKEKIRSLGGLDACNSFTRIYLSIFGLYSWDSSPSVPPELILFPNWFPFNLYKMSSWSRTIVVPLSIISAFKPLCKMPDHADISELQVEGFTQDYPKFSGASTRHRKWRFFFLAVDRFIKIMEKLHILPFRRWALKLSEKWILERLRKSAGLGAIFPPIINTIIAFKCLGYSDDDPRLLEQVRELEDLEIEEEKTLRVQPCKSPVWDTALALNALSEDNRPEDREKMEKSVQWLLEKEVREPGDWKVYNPEGQIGGWYFEYANEFYPDCDDTAQILSAVKKMGNLEGELGQQWNAAADRAIKWLLSMQNKDGGWASFDKGCDDEYLTFIPFADHNAMTDPSTSDITARMIEALYRYGIDKNSTAMKNAIEFLMITQEEDGSWFGRWGNNYIYGTYLSLWALDTIGEKPLAITSTAAEWLRKYQNPDGGWGESPDSYKDPALRGKGPSTPTQTAWALLGLLSAGDKGSEALTSGVGYLLDTQLSDGGWKDPFWAATGFPEVFYLNYHLYANHFPLLALERFRKTVKN